MPVLVLVGVIAWIALNTWRGTQVATGVTASGIIEADEVLLSPEVTGRLVALPLRPGDSVRVGDVVARLDDALVQLQIRQADITSRPQLELQADKFQLRSPLSGVVTRVPMRVGETAVPGQTIVVLTDPSRLEVTFYVREQDVGRVQLGQDVGVTADPFAGRAFGGRVTWISPRAEFTPRNVQTQRDRQNLVFAVKVQVDNSNGLLKPGLPVDATFTRSAT